jgi:hypothetical protein
MEGSNNKYDFIVDDTTSATSCYSAGNTYSALGSSNPPKYAEFMVENAQECSSTACAPLAKFTTAPFAGSQIYTSGSWSFINSFIWGAYDMENQAGTTPNCSGSYVVNVSYSTLGSSGSFTMTYQSSQYADFNWTGC